MKANPKKKKIKFMVLVKTPRQPIMFNINQIKVEKSQKVVYWVSQLIID